MAMTVERTPDVAGATAVAAPASRPLRSRYIVVVLMPIVVFLAVAGWYSAAWSDGEHQYLDMREQSVPGVVMLQGDGAVGGPTFYVYAEGRTVVTDVRVTDVAGTVVPVTMKSAPVENFGGLSPTQVASFTVRERPADGLLRVELVGSGAAARVGGYDATEFLRWERWVMAGLLIASVGASVAIIVVPIVRQRRHPVP